MRGTCWIVVGLPSPLIWKIQGQAGVAAPTVKSTLSLKADSTWPCCEWACWLTRSVPDASLMALRNLASKALILPLTGSGLVTCANAAGWLTTTYAEVAGAGLVWQTSATGVGVLAAGEGVFLAEPQAAVVSPARTTSVRYSKRTLLEEWAYDRPYTSNGARTRLLTSWLHRYKYHRAHTALGGQPAITRVDSRYGKCTSLTRPLGNRTGARGRRRGPERVP